MFIEGVIIGILLVLSLLVLELRYRMTYRPSKFIETIERSIKQRQKGHVILPEDEATLSRQDKLTKAREDGIDLRLEDL
jgi:hypothetical protein